jgi:glycosyltransferase involved in cell wall biosynthesis
MDILIVEPYYTGSHAAWAEGYRAHSRHQVEILKLAGANWKWRMHGGAVTLARRFEESGLSPDLVLATDMLDVTTFQALTRRRTAGTPFAVYFHENQLSYPWSPTDRDVLHKRDRHYGFINYASALACDAVFFNSDYHRRSFLEELVRLLRHFPDHNEPGSVETLRERSRVLPLGLELRRFDGVRPAPRAAEAPPLVVWNHRWEYDKNPEEFFEALSACAKEGIDFEVAVLGENFSQQPQVFESARAQLGRRVVQFGYAESFEVYAGWLRAARVAPVTSNQDFFGASVVEATYCGARPVLPRRLAYPELLPVEQHGAVFYDDGGFMERLTAALRDPWDAGAGLREHVSRFDWTSMAAIYDDALESLVNGS